MSAYYNEIDPEAVEVLRELVRCGVIAPGDVDGRSIKEVSADDVRGYTQCHFFAGAGLWSIAARLAGWPDDRPLWSASCPCQGESLAGKRLGADDPRHLWPDLYRILRAARPARIVGEQVAAAAGTHWLDRVCADMEDEDYAIRPIDIPACAVDAPHERNRLWWVALANAKEQRGGTGLREGGSIGHGSVSADGDGGNFILADAEGISRGREQPQRRPEGRAVDGRPDADGSVADADFLVAQGQPSAGKLQFNEPNDGASEGHQAYGRNGSWWADAEWLTCHDGKARRAKPGISMLVNGMAGRIGLWRLAGNSIVPQLAAEVIAALAEAEASVSTAASNRREDVPGGTAPSPSSGWEAHTSTPRVSSEMYSPDRKELP